MAVIRPLIIHYRFRPITEARYYLTLLPVSIIMLRESPLTMSGKYPLQIFQAMKFALFQRLPGKEEELLIQVQQKAIFLIGSNMRKKFRKNMSESGLTVIELIVAVGIFSLVIGMTIGIFVVSITTQRRVTALRNVDDNIRFTIESMAREIKTGKNFSSVANSLSFTNANGESVVYRLNADIVEKSSDGGTNYSAVTGSEVTVNYLNFYLMGQAAGDGLEPRITITIGATSQAGNQSANLKVQTTISERFLQS